MRTDFSEVVFTAFLVAVLGGCASASEVRSRPAQREDERRLPLASVRPKDDEWGKVRIPAFGLELMLPEANAWQDSAHGSWARLRHEPSESDLELGMARAGRLARPEDCEQRARLEKPALPRAPEEDTIDRRRLAAPPGFLTDLTVSVEAATPDAHVAGHVLAFGAAIGKCLTFHFATRAQGLGAEDEVARRLGLFVERVLPTLAVPGVDARVEPESFPSR